MYIRISNLVYNFLYSILLYCVYNYNYLYYTNNAVLIFMRQTRAPSLLSSTNLYMIYLYLYSVKYLLHIDTFFYI